MEKNFTFKIEQNDKKVLITLVGHLDANAAYPLMEDMKPLVGQEIEEIRYKADELAYISSAGLRVIIFSKQKIGYDADVIMEKPTESVVSVIEMSGIGNFISIEN